MLQMSEVWAPPAPMYTSPICRRCREYDIHNNCQKTTNVLTAKETVVVMPRTILSRRNRRCALSAIGTWKPEEEKDARGGTCFMEENEISLREVVRFDEYERDKV